jgi:hypothetical protein
VVKKTYYTKGYIIISLNSKLHRRVLFIFAVSILMIGNLAAMDEKSEDGELLDGQSTKTGTYSVAPTTG